MGKGEEGKRQHACSCQKAHKYKNPKLAHSNKHTHTHTACIQKYQIANYSCDEGDDDEEEAEAKAEGEDDQQRM